MNIHKKGFENSGKQKYSKSKEKQNYKIRLMNIHRGSFEDSEKQNNSNNGVG
jgi:predicted kinase